MAAWWRMALVCATAYSALPAQADVTAQTAMGFVSRNVIVVPGPSAAVWSHLIDPSAWWSPDHTFSGDAANLTLDPVAGGCFCETLPGEEPDPGKTAPRPRPRGGVEHLRVVYVDHARALRMTGALGPLQSEAVSATLTITLKQVDGGTRVIFEYVVGGYMRYPADKIAPAVDTMLGNQLILLGRAFGTGATGAQAPLPAAEGPAHGLDKNGLLLPHGRVWSLPSSAPVAPEPPPPAIPAPLATAIVPVDVAPTGGAMPDPPEPARPAKRPGKPGKKPAPASDEPTTDAVDAAFDAAVGGARRPPS